MLQIQQIPINSNRSCQKFLNCAGVATNEKLRQDPVLVPWFNRAVELKLSFGKGMDNLHAGNSTLVLAATERNTSGLKMERTARDYRSSLLRAIKRNEMPEFLPSFFRVPNGLSESQAKAREDWYQISHWLIKGEQKAREAGYIIETCPSIEELVICREVFAEKRILADVAERALKEVRTDMGDLRERVYITARGLAGNIRLVLYKEENASIRETLRGYGFSFRGNGGEVIPEANNSEEPVRDEPDLHPPLPETPRESAWDERQSFSPVRDEPIHLALVRNEPSGTDASLHETADTPTEKRLLEESMLVAPKGEDKPVRPRHNLRPPDLDFLGVN